MNTSESKVENGSKTIRYGKGLKASYAQTFADRVKQRFGGDVKFVEIK